MNSSPPKASERRVAERVGAAIAVLIGDDEVEVLAVAIRAVADQAVDRGQVVWLVAKAVLVPLFDCDILSPRADRSFRARVR